jgi:esterase/lipase
MTQALCLINEYPVEKPKGIMVVVHGLNLNPLKMLDLVTFFNQQGLTCLHIALKGHRFEGKTDPRFSFEDWQKEVAEILVRLETYAPDLPRYLCAYSLGAGSFLYHLEFVADQLTFDQMILIAPAVETKWFLKLAAFMPKMPSSWRIPSKSEDHYGADSKGTLIAELEGTVAMAKALRNWAKWKTRAIPTLCFVSPQDEVISYRNTVRLIEQTPLTYWQVKTFHRNPRPPFQWYHILIDQKSLGPKNWEYFCSESIAFLNAL